MTKEKQPYPNHNWCVGCTPDSCSGCGTEPADRRKPAVEVEPVALVSGYYGGRSVYQPLVNWILPVGTALYTHAPDSAVTVAALEKRIAELEAKVTAYEVHAASVEAENAALKADAEELDAVIDKARERSDGTCRSIVRAAAEIGKQL